MAFLSIARRAAMSAAEKVPDVMVTFGTRLNRITFISHPGVMAVAKLLEMRYLTRPRAVLTQENVDAIREFDEDLARKAQMALDNSLHINFMELEHIEKPGYLERLKREKQILDTARAEVLAAPRGDYKIPPILQEYERPEVPRSWRPDLELEQEIYDVEPGLKEDIELQSLVRGHLQKQIVEEKAKLGISSSQETRQIEDRQTKQLPKSS